MASKLGGYNFDCGNIIMDIGLTVQLLIIMDSHYEKSA
jgi:hypothetical protein